MSVKQPLLSVREIALSRGVSKQTVLNWIRKRDCPYELVGNSIVVRLDDAIARLGFENKEVG